MGYRIMALLLWTTLLLSAVPSAFGCPYTRHDYEFTCGFGLNCQYIQHYNQCVTGGCKDCISGCGSGQCTCGSDTYESDCLVPCDAALVRTGAAEQEVAAVFARPDCHGVYSRSARNNSSRRKRPQPLMGIVPN
jgi:hypothetical protein